jgi:hypothetical protein
MARRGLHHCKSTRMEWEQLQAYLLGTSMLQVGLLSLRSPSQTPPSESRLAKVLSSREAVQLQHRPAHPQAYKAAFRPKSAQTSR